MSNVTFNQLPAASALTGTEILPVNQVSTTKRATTQQISDYVASEISGDFATVDHNHTALYEPVNANIQQHIADTNNPHGITADQVIESVSKVLFTPTERTKLSGIATGAEVNVNTDWDSTSGDSQLINKPTINVSAGVYTHPSFTDNLNGSCTVGAGEYILYNNAEYAGESRRYAIAGGTFTLTDNSINYILADYNAGTPVVRLTSNLAELNDSSNTPIFSIYRIGNNLHNIDWDSLGKGLSNKLNKKDRVLNRFQIEKGLTLNESPTRLVTTTAGTVWYGGASLDLPSAISSTDPTFLWSHSGGSWIFTPVTQYNNTQYDNGTNLVTLTNNRYAVIWVYRGVYTSSNSINMVLGTGDYSLTQAQDSVVPSLPSFVATTNVLVGRIIVQKSASTATQINIVSSVSFSGSNANNHSDLLGLDYASSGHTGFSPDTHNHTGVYEPANANIQSHISSTSNPHSTTAAQVGAVPTTDVVTTAAANKILKLNASSKLPASITGDAATVGGNLPSAFAAAVHAHDTAYEAKNTNIQTHIASTSNPHSVTATQVGLGNVTNDAQVKRSEMGAANGVATLGADSKVPTSQLPAAIVGQVIYQGVWDASTNNPTIPTASSSNNGWYYIVSVAGSTNIDGITDWKVGDWIISQGTAWKKVDNTDSVSSVFGRTGDIAATSGDYTADQITETATRVFITPAQETIINNTSGVNTGDQDLSGLEPDLGNPSVDGQVLSSTTAGVRSWITPSGTIERETIIVSTTAPASPEDGDLWLDESQGVQDQTNYIDATNMTADYPLRRGETAIVNYSAATSVPLHIKTVEGIYEIIVTGNRTTAIANNNAGTFYPNNTSGQTFLGTYRWAGWAGGVASAYTDCPVAEGRLSKCYVRAHTTTSAKSLSIRYSFQKSDSSAWFAEIETDWIDTTTTWSSLGTVNLPFAQSGTIIIRRIY